MLFILPTNTVNVNKQDTLFRMMKEKLDEPIDADLF